MDNCETITGINESETEDTVSNGMLLSRIKN